MTRSLLWIDCSAGAAVGVGMLALHVPMAHWYELPVGLLLGMGAANLVYASFSLSLARDPDRSLGRVSQLEPKRSSPCRSNESAPRARHSSPRDNSPSK